MEAFDAQKTSFFRKARPESSHVTIVAAVETRLARSAVLLRCRSACRRAGTPQARERWSISTLFTTSTQTTTPRGTSHTGDDQHVRPAQLDVRRGATAAMAHDPAHAQHADT